MARKVGDPTLLKARLEAALKQAKPSDIASAQPMAEIVGMTWAGFRNTHVAADKNFPIKTKGAEGKQWEFQVVKVLKYMIKICDKKIAANNHRNRRNAELVGINLPDSDSGADIAEVSKLTELTLKIQQAKERQGEYVPAEKVADFIAGYNSAVINGLLGITNQVDPTGLMPAETRKEMDDLVRNLAVSVQESAKKYIEGINENIRKG